MARAIYVETSVAAGPGVADRLWTTTQDPALHPRWDLHFSAIVPSGADGSGQQRFTYELALPHPRFALVTVCGTGTSTGERRSADGAGTSSISFVSRSVLSPLAQGSGHWRYAPEGGRIRFATGYDYRPGWGALGAALDPWLLRPAVGWATALRATGWRRWTGLLLAVAAASAPPPAGVPAARRCRRRPPPAGRRSAPRSGSRPAGNAR